MKKIVPILLLCFIGCKQQDKGKPVVVVSPSKMKVLYLGVNNPVSIVASGIPSYKIKVRVDDSLGSVKGDSGKYEVAVRTKLPTLKITVNKIDDNNKEEFLDTLIFKVRPVPSPIVSIAGQTGECTLSREEIVQAGGIVPKINNFVFDMRFPVISYNLSANINGLWIDSRGNGPAFTEEMKKLISKLESAGRILIEDVWIQAPEGKRKIPGMVIKIK